MSGSNDSSDGDIRCHQMIVHRDDQDGSSEAHLQEQERSTSQLLGTIKCFRQRALPPSNATGINMNGHEIASTSFADRLDHLQDCLQDETLKRTMAYETLVRRITEHEARLVELESCQEVQKMLVDAMMWQMNKGFSASHDVPKDVLYRWLQTIEAGVPESKKSMSQVSDRLDMTDAAIKLQSNPKSQGAPLWDSVWDSVSLDEVAQLKVAVEEVGVLEEGPMSQGALWDSGSIDEVEQFKVAFDRVGVLEEGPMSQGAPLRDSGSIGEVAQFKVAFEERLGVLEEGLEQRLQHLERWREDLYIYPSVDDVESINIFESPAQESIRELPDPAEEGQRMTRTSSMSEMLQETLKSVSYDLFREQIKVSQEYEIRESIWDAAFFIGLNALGCGGSVVMFLLLLCNTGCQLLFCFVVANNFGESTLNDITMEGLRKWRDHIAHDVRQLDSLTDTSLASRVCSEEGRMYLAVSENQADMVETIGAYRGQGGTLSAFGSIPEGSIICVLAVLCWYLWIATDIHVVVDRCRALLAVKRGLWCHIAFTGNKNKVEMRTMSGFRASLGVLLSMLQLIVALILGYSGTFWLVFTLSTEDLLLNAVALSFVMDIDELIFSSLAPHSTRDFVRNLKPFKSPPRMQYRGIDAQTAFITFATVACLCYAVTSILMPEIRKLDVIEDLICGGNQDFVYMVGSTGFVHWFTTNPYEDREMDGYTSLVIDMLKDSNFESELTDWTSLSLSSFSRVNEMSTVDVISEWNPKCRDMLDIRTGAQNIVWGGPLNDGLKHLGIEANITSCKDERFASLCKEDSFVGMNARFACPRRCGCDSPSLQLVMADPSYGCGIGCRYTQDYIDELNSAACTDPSPSQLRANGDWTGFASQIVEVSTSWSIYYQERAAQLQTDMLQLGCGVIEHWKDEKFVDLCRMEEPMIWQGIRSLSFVCPVSCACAQCLALQGESCGDCPASCKE